MKYSNYCLIASVAVSFASVSTLNSQVLFSENFEGWIVGQPTTDSGSDPQRWKSDGDPFDIIEQDTGNVFGRGTSNQFIRFGNVPVGGALPGGSLDIEQRSYDTGGGVPTGVLRVSFDFFEPSSGSGKGFVSDLSEPGYLRIRGDGGVSGVHIITFDDGLLRVDSTGTDIFTFGEDTMVRFDFIFNQSGSDATYMSNVINSGNFAVYADGTLVGANLSSGVNNPTVEIERILLRTEYAAGGSAAQEMWIDNWETAVVPEPSTFALMAGGLILGMVLLRRQKKIR